MEAFLRDATDRYRSFQSPWGATVKNCIGQGFLALSAKDRRRRRQAVAPAVCTAWISHRRHSMTFDSYSDHHDEVVATPRGETLVTVELTLRQYGSEGAIQERYQVATLGRP
jgi:hypothetical protein